MSQIDLQHVDDQMLHAQTDECTSSSALCVSVAQETPNACHCAGARSLQSPATPMSHATTLHREAAEAASVAAAEVRQHSAWVDALLAEGFPDNRTGRGRPSTTSGARSPVAVGHLVAGRRTRVQSAGTSRQRSTGSGLRAARAGRRSQPLPQSPFNFTNERHQSAATTERRPTSRADGARSAGSQQLGGPTLSSPVLSSQAHSRRPHSSWQQPQQPQGSKPNSRSKSEKTLGTVKNARGRAKAAFGADRLTELTLALGNGTTAPNPTPTPSRRQSTAQTRETLAHLHVHDAPGFILPSTQAQGSRPRSRDVSFTLDKKAPVKRGFSPGIPLLWCTALPIQCCSRCLGGCRCLASPRTHPSHANSGGGLAADSVPVAAVGERPTFFPVRPPHAEMGHSGVPLA